MKVLMYRTGSLRPFVKTVADPSKAEACLRDLQELVGGWIEVHGFALNNKDYYVVCDEEARFKCKRINPATVPGFVSCFFGTILICGKDFEELAGLTDEDIKILKKAIKMKV